jgi:DTW domain-containing protein YfiP
VTAGYSATPLGKKLGYRATMRVFVDDMPDPIRHDIERSIEAKPNWLFVPEAELEAAHVFVKTRAALEEKLLALMPLLAPSAFIWVSWPKKTSKVATDIAEDTIREVCLPMGLVDVKVCAVDATWSGLKLMLRKDRR